MKCLYPFMVDRYKDGYTKKGYPIRIKCGVVQVPCGRCPACRRRKQNEWAFRCMEEAKDSRLTCFITLTYDDDHLPFSGLGEATLVKHHLQKYFKDLRYWLGDIRYYACGEYGDKFGRPHYHALLFYNGVKSFDDVSKILTDRWIYGISDVQNGVTPANAKYCCKYSMKSLGFDYGDCLPPFALMSRRPGIGKKFLDRIDIGVFRRHQIFVVHDNAGTPYSIPRIYRDRIFSEAERLQHSLILERECWIKDQYQTALYYSDNDCPKPFSDFDIIHSVEQQFIKKLKKDLYGFKYTPAQKRERSVRYRLDASDLDGRGDFISTFSPGFDDDDLPSSP